MHHFRGRTDRHLRGILSIFRDETALQTYLHIATMCPTILTISRDETALQTKLRIATMCP
jgi:hypothetical protein